MIHHFAHDIPDRDQTDDMLALHDGKVPHMLIGHDLHALVDILRCLDGDDLRSHDVLYQSIAAASTLEYHFARIVSLRKNTCQLRSVHDQQGSDIFLCHQLQRLTNRSIRSDSVDEAMAFGQKMSGSFHDGFLSYMCPNWSRGQADIYRARQWPPPNGGGFARAAQGCLPLARGLPLSARSPSRRRKRISAP